MASLFNIRSGEWRRLLPLTTAYGLVLASIYVLKPVRNTLFLDRIGIERLPYVLILVAIVGGLSASLYTRLTDRIRIDRLILGTFLLLAANLILFQWLFSFHHPSIYYIFYIWVNLYGLLVVSLLWLQANALFNPREARRLFGLIGTGGIGGAIVGGVFTRWAADHVGTENLTFVCAGILVICAGLVRLGSRPDSDSPPPRTVDEVGESAFAIIRRVGLLRRIAIIAAITAVVAAIVDVQFNEAVSRAYPSSDQKTAFFGEFFAYLNGFAFFFQLLITPVILRTVGIGPALCVLPIATALGSGAILLLPGMIGGIAVKIGDIGFRHSIQKSAMEILYLPIPPNIKNRAKVLLDTTIDNLATGVGAILVLLLTTVFGVAYGDLAYLTFGLVAIWLGVLISTRRAYVDAFRRGLERREIDADAFRSDFTESSIDETLTNVLQSSQERQLLYAVDMIGLMGAQRWQPAIQPLLDNPHPSVRAAVLRTLTEIPAKLPDDLIDRLVDDEDLDVRVEAIRQRVADNTDALSILLSHSRAELKVSALAYISRYGGNREEDLVHPRLVEELVGHSEASRAQVAQALGGIDKPDLLPYLDALKEDELPDVFVAATRSLGLLKHETQIPWLIEKLADGGYRAAARDALINFGDAALDPLVQILNNETHALRQRRVAARTLGRIPSTKVVRDLIETLSDTVESDLEYEIIKSLNKLRQAGVRTDVNEDFVDTRLTGQIQQFCERRHAQHILESTSDTPALSLFKQTLEEKSDQTLELAFRLLGLQYPPRDVYHAFLGVTGPDRRVRASAIEFLDNILHRRHTELIVPCLDPQSPGDLVDFGVRRFGQKFWTVDEVVSYFMQQNDTWLRVCAVHCVKDLGVPYLRNLVQDRRNDASPIVSETAEWVLHNA